MKPPLAATVAVAYGAGLATGLAHFSALGCTALVLGALLAGWPSRTALAAAAYIGGLLGGALALARDGRSCAATLSPTTLILTVRAAEPVDSGGSRTDGTLPRLSCNGAVAVRWPNRFAAPAGAEAEVTARWRPRPGRFGRPGGILVVTEVSAVRVRPGLAERLRTVVHQESARLFGRRAPVVDALIIGRRGDLDPALMDAFAASGLVHLLSISGFHLGLLAGWVYALLRLASVRREAAGLASAAFGVLYAVLLGWPAPAARAAALLGVVAVERARQRNPDTGALLATTALAVVLLDPWAVLDLGGWLSVAALWGAGTFAAWSDRRLGRHAAVQTLFGSIGATLATAPLTALALGTVALIGVLLNFVAIPVAALVVPATAVSLLLGVVAEPLAAPLAAGAGAGLGLLSALAHLGAAVPFGHLVVASGPAAALPWVGCLVAALWCLRGTTRAEALRRGLWVGTAALWLWLLVSLAPAWRLRPDEGSGLTLHFLDVGQGDALAIRTPGGHWVLVDAGPAGAGSDAGRSVVVPFLRRHGVVRLEAILVSHAHADHLGGVPSVLDRLPAGEVLEPGVLAADARYGEFLAQLDQLGEPWIAGRRGDRFVVDSVEFQLLHPDTAWGGWGLDLNENSLVVLVTYRRFTALLAGDAGLPAEAALAGRVGAVDLLKVGHHGSRGATGAAWLRELGPRAAVISVGQGNRYGHPSPEALGRLRAAGVDVHRTDHEGAIEVRTDGATMTIRSRRGAATYTVSDP